jgi:hypothetical protein
MPRYPTPVRRGLIWFAALMVCVLPACGGNEQPSELSGVILKVNATSITDVESFTLKSGDERHRILIDASADYGFPLSHLQEHVLSGDPVDVELEERDGQLYAQSIVDSE